MLKLKPNKILCSFDETLQLLVEQRAPVMKLLQCCAAGDGEAMCIPKDVTVHTCVDIANITQITSGWYSMLGLTGQGQVFGRGANKYGELALGDFKAHSTWTKIYGFPSPIAQIAYNCSHSLFLTIDGQVFSCGNNVHGQLVCFK